MGVRSPARARFLGLWSAGWLATLLVLAMLRFGDPALQWPVLLVPALWALVALRPRRPAPSRPARPRRRPAEEGWAQDGWAGEERAEEERAEDGRARYRPAARPWPPAARRLPPGERTDTVERPALRRRADGTGHR